MLQLELELEVFPRGPLIHGGFEYNIEILVSQGLSLNIFNIYLLKFHKNIYINVHFYSNKKAVIIFI
jgi:hypothetical protein